jgi:hypothetical protein
MSNVLGANQYLRANFQSGPNDVDLAYGGVG